MSGISSPRSSSPPALSPPRICGDRSEATNLLTAQLLETTRRAGQKTSEAQMFANAGYMSTIDPAGGVTDSVIRIPNINFDYANGEKLIVYWLRKSNARRSFH